MARASFTLRRDGVAQQGSYLQYPPSFDGSASVTFPPLASDDLYLRADSLSVAPILQTAIPGGNEYATAAFFDVSVTDYNQVRISWGVPLVSTLTTTPQADQVIVSYSSQGEPDTITDGTALIETTTDNLYNHDVPAGKWAYYTLFLRYRSSTGDLYYEPAAKLSVLVPKYYGSAEDLYDKIPLFYRLKDSEVDDGNGGPLYRYLSILGWDIDRFRTLIDYLISCKDPQQVRSQELDLLAQDLGLDLSSRELGAARLRALVDNIGTTRRTNGLPSSITASLVALTGSEVDINTTTNVIRIRPQRVNYVKDPTIRSGLDSTFDGGSPNSTFSSVVNAGPASPPTTPGATDIDGGTPSSTFTSGGTNFWSESTVGGVRLLRTVGADVPIAAGDVYYLSVHSDGQSSVSQVALENTTVTPRTTIVANTTPSVIGGRNYWKLVVPTTALTSAGIRIDFTASAASPTSDTISRVLVEKNNIGDYFDGTSRRGGWVGNPDGSGVADFQWAGDAHGSYSLYNSNFQKTRTVIARLIGSLLPVNQLVSSGTIYSNVPITPTYYTITYNYLGS